MSDPVRPEAAIESPPVLSAPGWPIALALLLAGLVLLGLLFAEEAVSALGVWETSETYNHCWLVAPIAAWLAWSRRHRLAGIAPQPAPLFALLAVPVGLAWLVAERLGIMEGRQLMALTLMLLLVPCLLGWQVTRAMAAPLIYLYFLVPFGAFATPALQQVTARMVDVGLNLTGISHYVDDLVIETPAGVFLVAEACAGLRFLIAALAFGALYAFVMFRSPGRRILVMVLALVVPIFANGLRALGIVVLGQILGSAEAAAADHVVYGWVFFSAVILLLILAGLPFRQDTQPEAWPAPGPEDARAPSGVALLAGAVLGMALTAAGPVLALALNAAGGRAPRHEALALAAPEICESAPAGALRCGPYAVTAEAVIFPAQATWRLVSMESGRITGLGDQDYRFAVTTPGARWQGRQSREEGQTVAIGTWLNGAPSGGGIRARIEQAWNSLGGGRGRPVLVAVSMRPPEPGRLSHAPAQRELMARILAAQGATLAERGAALSAPR